MSGKRAHLQVAPSFGEFDHPPQRLGYEAVERLALRDYRTTRDTAKAIAARYGIDLRVLRQWVDSAGYPRRPRGRQRLREPSTAQKAILERVGSVSLVQLAVEVCKSRQYLAELAKRWPAWVGRKRLSPGATAQPSRNARPVALRV